MPEPRTFVQKIWALQGKLDGATGFVAQKDWETGDWKEVPTQAADEIPDMERDWYFAPCLFTGKRRLREAARPSRVLYADLDEVDPATITDVPPTLAWETSPGRYQAIWVVDRRLKLDQFENLNRRLTYHVGADKGGWSSTKVLRIPGTVSTKYGKSRAKRFTVQVCRKGRKYTVQDLHRLLRTDPDVSAGGSGSVQWGDLPEAEKVRRTWMKKLPQPTKRLLRSEPNPEDDRSAVLYQLEGKLLAAGLSPEETLALVRESGWNKYRGQRRELRQLKHEIAKQAEEQSVREVERMVGRVRVGAKRNGHDKKLAAKLAQRQKEMGLAMLSYREFLDAHFPEPQWLVEGFWGLGAYGVWAGEFKSFKTVTLLDFALSVASGKPFLNTFKVHRTGPVLYAHDEGTPGYIQDRLRRVAWQKGVAGGSPNGNKFEIEFPKDLPLWVATAPKLNLTEEESQRRLATVCEQQKPLVIILESFYLMAQDIDENSAREVTPALAFLKDLAQEYGTGVIVSHHYNKDSSSAEGKKRRPGLRMSGSSVFGRWYESSVYLEREGDETEGKAVITAEHREQKGIGKQHLQVEMDTEDEVHYDVRVVDSNTMVGSQGDEGAKPARPTIDVQCPECGAEPDARCKDAEGKDRVFHQARKIAAKSGEEPLQKVDAKDVSCPTCNARPGARCRNDEGSTGTHQTRKDLAQAKSLLGGPK